MKNVDLFVYGVLMFAELRQALTGQVFATSPAVLGGYRRYQVKAQQFPALQVHPETVTQGVLLHDVDPATLALFDLFEDVDAGLFHKHEVDVETAGGERHRALVYIAGPAIRHDDLSGLWDPQQFAGRQLQLYIETVVSEFLQEIELYEQR